MKWWHLAECQYIGTEVFFPEGKGTGTGGYVQQAKRICAGCPVREECLEDALLEEYGYHRERRFGIRGGATANDRYEMAKKRGETPRTIGKVA